MYWVSNSEITAWNRCKRRWAYEYFFHRRTRERIPAFAIGNLWHELMDLYYHDPDGEGYDHAILHLTQARLMDPNNAKDHELLFAMLTGYKEWLDEYGEDYKLNFTHIEEVGEMQLTDEVGIRCKVDILVEDKDTGWVYIWDHKTATNMNTLLLTLPLKQQLRTYTMIVNNDPNLPTVAGAYLNIAKKVKRNNTAKPPFYLREPVHLSQGILDNHEEQVETVATQICRAHQNLTEGVPLNLVVPPSVTDDCSWCPYFEVCRSQDDPESDWEWDLETNFRLENPNARYDEETE